MDVHLSLTSSRLYMVKWIAFDWKDTLYDSVLSGKISQEKLLNLQVLKNNGFHFSIEDYNKYKDCAIKRIKEEFKDTYTRHTPGLFYKLFGECAGRPFPIELSAKMEQEYDELSYSIIQLFPGTIEMLEELKKKYQLAIISNTRMERILAVLEATKTRRFFDVVIASYDIKGEKSTLKPFHAFLKKTNANPNEVIMVGNRIAEDLAGEKIGIKSILVDMYNREPDYEGIVAHKMNDIPLLIKKFKG